MPGKATANFVLAILASWWAMAAIALGAAESAKDTNVQIL